MTTATETFLARDTPVTAILRPHAAGEATAEQTREALLAVEWADVPHGTADQLMGRDGGDYVAGLEPGDAPVEGSWDELLAARDLGIVTADEVAAVLEGIVARGGDRG